jgi:hypothetical protein
MASRKRACPHFTPLWGVIKAGSSEPGLFVYFKKSGISKLKIRFSLIAIYIFHI